MAGIVPTKSNLMAAQKSLRLAKLGYELLDRKKNILIRELLQYTDGAKDMRKKMDDAYKTAYDSLRMASLTLGRCGTFADSVPEDNTIELENKSVMGMMLPTLTMTGNPHFAYFGLVDTNSYLDEAYTNFREAKRLTVELCAMESDICRLADAVKKTQKRANALCNVQIPMLTERIKLISEALDEKEREDFSRLKMIKKQ